MISFDYISKKRGVKKTAKIEVVAKDLCLIEMETSKGKVKYYLQNVKTDFRRDVMTISGYCPKKKDSWKRNEDKVKASITIEITPDSFSVQGKKGFFKLKKTYQFPKGLLREMKYRQLKSRLLSELA